MVPVMRDAYIQSGDRYRAALVFAPDDLRPLFQDLVNAHDTAVTVGGHVNGEAEYDAATAVEAACSAT